MFFGGVAFSQSQRHRIFLSKNSSADSVAISFYFAEKSTLQFYKNDKLIQSVDFQGTKKFSFQRFALCPNMRFCESEKYLQVYLLDDAHNNSFHKPNEVKIAFAK
jgi:hypothetical protein